MNFLVIEYCVESILDRNEIRGYHRQLIKDMIMKGIPQHKYSTDMIIGQTPAYPEEYIFSNSGLDPITNEIWGIIGETIILKGNCILKIKKDIDVNDIKTIINNIKKFEIPIGYTEEKLRFITFAEFRFPDKLFGTSFQENEINRGLFEGRLKTAQEMSLNPIYIGIDDDIKKYDINVEELKKDFSKYNRVHIASIDEVCKAYLNSYQHNQKNN